MLTKNWRSRERRLDRGSDIWTLSWNINTGIQGTDSGAKDIWDRENMCGQRLENEKTFDKSREWVFGCGTSPRVWKKILNQESCWFRKESLMAGAGFHPQSHIQNWCIQISRGNRWSFRKLFKNWAQLSFICASVLLKFSLSTDKHYKLAQGVARALMWEVKNDYIRR